MSSVLVRMNPSMALVPAGTDAKAPLYVRDDFNLWCNLGTRENERERRRGWGECLSADARRVATHIVRWQAGATLSSVHRQLEALGPSGVLLAAAIIDADPDIRLLALYETVRAVLS